MRWKSLLGGVALATSLTLGCGEGPTGPGKTNPPPDTTTPPDTTSQAQVDSIPPVFDSLVIDQDSVAYGRGFTGRGAAHDNTLLDEIGLRFAQGCPLEDVVERVSAPSAEFGFQGVLNDPSCTSATAFAQDTAGNQATRPIQVKGFYAPTELEAELSVPADTAVDGELRGTAKAPQGLDSLVAVIGSERTHQTLEDSLASFAIPYHLTEIGTYPVRLSVHARGDRTAVYEDTIRVLDRPNQAPVVESFAAAQETVREDEPVVLLASFSDDRELRQAVLYRLVGSDTAVVDTIPLSGTSYDASMEVAADTGTHRFLVRPVDNFGARGAFAETSARKDPAPRVSLTLPDDAVAYDSIGVNIHVEDQNLNGVEVGCDSGCQSVVIQSGEPIVDGVVNLYTEHKGPNRFFVRAADQLGQSSEASVQRDLPAAERTYTFRVTDATDIRLAELMGGNLLIDGQAYVGDGGVWRIEAEIGDHTIRYQDEGYSNPRQVIREFLGHDTGDHLGRVLGRNIYAEGVQVHLPPSGGDLELVVVPDRFDFGRVERWMTGSDAASGKSTVANGVLCPQADLTPDSATFSLGIYAPHVVVNGDLKNAVISWMWQYAQQHVTGNHRRFMVARWLDSIPDHGHFMRLENDDTAPRQGDFSYEVDQDGCRVNLVARFPWSSVPSQEALHEPMMNLLYFGSAPAGELQSAIDDYWIDILESSSVVEAFGPDPALYQR